MGIKQYIEEYKDGNFEVLNELIGYRQVNETNEYGTKDTVIRLRFNVEALDAMYWQLLVNYKGVDSKEMDHIINKAFFRVDDDNNVNSIFDNVDLTMPDKQILMFIRRKLDGFIKNELQKENKEYGDYITSDTVTLEDGEEVSKTDLESYKRFKEADGKVEAYAGFKQYIGGIDNFLKGNQLKIYQAMQDMDKSQQDIADDMDMYQQQVSDTLKRIGNKLNKKYVEWNTLKSLSGSKNNTYVIIKEFLHNFNRIIDFDTTDSFDYFGFVIEFLKDNHEDDEMDMEALQGNKVDTSLTVIDVVTDYCKAKTYKVMEQVLVNSNITYKKQDKKSFYMDVIKCFNKYINDVGKSVEGFSSQIVNSDSPMDIKDTIQ